MTHCRTGCGAEINYKRVYFSTPVDWYDIPMEGDVIHDCPKLKPSTNDGANDVLKELQDMHMTLNENFLSAIESDFDSPILNFIDLPQKLKMHSKEKLAERIDVNALGGEMPREDFDKLPKSEKEEYKEFYGSEPPNQTPEERQADLSLIFDFDPEISEQKEGLFKLKLQMFEQDIVKNSKSKVAKATIRKASTPIEAIVAYKKFIKK